jgi:hypothetical protein
MKKNEFEASKSLAVLNLLDLHVYILLIMGQSSDARLAG